MKIILFCFLVIFQFNSSIYCQEETPLNRVEQYIKHLDTTFLLKNEPEKAFANLLDFKERNNITNFEEQDNLYYGLSKYLYYSKEFEQAIKYSDSGYLFLKKENKNHKNLSDYYNIKGASLVSLNKPDSAVVYFLKTIDILKFYNENLKVAFTKNNISSIYVNNGDFKNALPYLEDAFNYLKSNDISNRHYPLITGNLAYAYAKEKQLDKANEMANLAIELGNKSQSIDALFYGYTSKKEIGLLENQKDSALFFAKKAFDIAKQYNNNYYEGLAAYSLSFLYKENNPKQAISLGEMVINSKVITEKPRVSELYQLLGDTYYQMNNFEKAAYYQKLYISIQDSIRDQRYTETSLELLKKYETAEKELIILQQQGEITKKENQKRTYSIIAASLAAIALLLIVLFIQNRKTQKQKIVNLEKEKENIALRSLMAGEEKERSRIAKELHDGIGSLLAASKMHASKLHADNSESNQTLLTLLDNASKETRRISHNLLPESLMNKGLDVALQDFISSINESQLLKADYQSINLSSTLPQSLQLSIYRIVQELINNIIKHSEATQALVQLNQNKNKLIITVEDNGKGFAFDTSNKGIGLQNIESRLSLLNGKIEVDSRDALGTSVYIEFELEK